MEIEDYSLTWCIVSSSAISNCKVEIVYREQGWPYLNNESSLNAQLKFIVEDFEGLADGIPDLKKNGIFTYGNIKASIEQNNTTHPDNSGVYLGGRAVKLIKEGNLSYGGWGKGIGLNVELDLQKDYLNFYVLPGKTTDIKIELQEDDNSDNIYDKNADDSWTYVQKLDVKNKWQLVSVPLIKFQDANNGGNSLLDINYKKGKLICLIISFIDTPLE
ncbi:MAG: hypothetical protein H0W84_07140, partial [Bacteroidetes bacterium]|nr:hypothetical protein [Bacteroidota bacterium]